MFETVVDSVGGKAAVIAGTGTNNTKKSVELTREAEKTGVDGIMAVAPYYNKPPQEGLYQHFRSIAEATSLPVMVYNVPGRTSVNITPATMARLAEIENIIALKEAAGNLEQAAEMARVLPKNFLLYSGDDSMTLPILAVGGVGVVSVASHLAGRKIALMVESYLQGEVEKAAEINKELLPLFKVLFLTTNPIMVKAALNLLGINVGPTRLPLVPATEAELEKLKTVLAQLGLLA